jgi:predicted transcriptional regulator
MSAEPARISIDVPEPIKIELERLAAERNVSEADLVTEALARFVDEEADYLAAIDEALAEVEDGAFVSGESVVTWMRSWGTDRELPRPEADILPSKG